MIFKISSYVCSSRVGSGVKEDVGADGLATITFFFGAGTANVDGKSLAFLIGTPKFDMRFSSFSSPAFRVLII
jgi:hypothetical protein